MISNKCYYALRAMLELAKREGNGPMTISDIARAQQIPARFLEAILRELKQTEFTDSVRGKDGGYTLARPAREITMGDVIRLFEGPLVSVSACRNRKGEAREAFDAVWEKAEHALSSVYDDTSFADLVDMDRELTMSDIADYSI